jgi:hypothetical protein
MYGRKKRLNTTPQEHRGRRTPTKAIIISGDGDFYCLAEYLEQNNKLLHLITPNETYSHILSRFSGFIVRVDQLRSSLEQT